MSSLLRLTMGLLLLVSGCVSTKAQRKPDEVLLVPPPDAKERSLILFKEGAALLNDDPRAAVFKFSQARELDPTNIPAWYNEGVAHELNGDAESALKNVPDLTAAVNKAAAPAVETQPAPPVVTPKAEPPKPTAG